MLVKNAKQWKVDKVAIYKASGSVNRHHRTQIFGGAGRGINKPRIMFNISGDDD